ncbi:E3 ubiquitin-protein ligase SH3RF2 isoform X2 [Nerophis ophidion]|uniref:E3 ubiquitin-protein ligase SH3RF2 isoform X2 n=1 Tax=Nerophis ophidion TaxID=159077 RepID=UPI002ADF557C|nr:E3 ubiquitin-protein ligase SH3RF2 isoform X2 [Nerophis ophidion]
MEDPSLAALLECPLCSEQLDMSAKVLPCQHTFCKACLQRQEAAHSQLFCPECRTPVNVRTVEELPENILLMRLLEGLQGSVGQGRNTHYAVPFARRSGAVSEGHRREHQDHKEVFGKASMRSLQGDAPGELVLAPANGITLKHSANGDWHYRHNSDTGSASISQMPQTIAPQQSLALCRALCDFSPTEMNVEKSDYCLSFRKLNSVAAKLLEGKSPRGSDSTEYQHKTGSRGKDKASEASGRTNNQRATQLSAKTPHTHTPAPFNLHKQPRPSSGDFSHTAAGEKNNISGFNLRQQSHRSSVRPATRGHSHPSRVRRHSDIPHKHLLLNEKMANEAPPNISMALLNPQMSSSSADSKTSTTQQLSISVCAVLYSYKPHRPEELELRKGEMVGVYGKFKEGWLRGLSLRTGKVGVLPSNYITPVLRTSARLLETKAASSSSQHSTAAGKKPTAARNPVLAVDRVNTNGSQYPAAQVAPVPNGVQHAMSSPGAGKSSFYGSSQGWETVRRFFNPQRVSNPFNHSSNLNVPSYSEHFAQVQASGYSPAMQRKKNGGLLPGSGRTVGRPSEPTVLSAVPHPRDRDFTSSHETGGHYLHERQPSSGPQSILIRPEFHKSPTDKPVKSVRFVTDEDPSLPRLRTSSWSSGSQLPSSFAPVPPSLDAWAPSLTLGRDGPGIILKDGKAPALRKGMETLLSDVNSNPQKTMSSHPPLSTQFSPSRHRVTTTHLAQMDSELSLLQGELVLVHRPRPDGRVLVTQESSGRTGLFHSSILHGLERIS